MADATYTPKVYKKDGGNTLVVASGGSIQMEPGGYFLATPVAVGSALTVTSAHAGRTLKLDTAAGSTATLPASTGSGLLFRFVVSALATSNSHVIKVANSSDIMQGVVGTIDTDTAGTITGWATAADSDTITLNRGTTGSTMIGEWIECEDIAANKWAVRGQLANTGSGATPFSAAV